MAFTYTGSTTLSAALNNSDTDFNVASTTGIVKGMLLVTAAEIMYVRNIPVAGRVSVRRGYQNTRALPHNSGDTVYFDYPYNFGLIKDNALKLFGPALHLPDICIPGTRGFDANGYEYLLVDMTATVVPGATVVISKDGLYTAAVLLASTGVGLVGVTMEDGTSDQWVWVLRRGLHPHAKLVGGSSLGTSTGVLVATTAASSPSVGLQLLTTSQAATSTNMDGELPRIMGMWPASAWTSASTSATSETGGYCAVWLENPYIMRRLTS